MSLLYLSNDKQERYSVKSAIPDCKEGPKMMSSQSRTVAYSRNNREWWDRFKQLLDEQNDWPAEYLFKFIVPKAGFDDLKAIFGDHPIKVRASTRGNYLSVTAKMMMESSTDVVRMYAAAGRVEGVVSL